MSVPRTARRPAVDHTAFTDQPGSIIGDRLKAWRIHAIPDATPEQQAAARRYLQRHAPDLIPAILGDDQ